MKKEQIIEKPFSSLLDNTIETMTKTENIIEVQLKEMLSYFFDTQNKYYEDIIKEYKAIGLEANKQSDYRGNEQYQVWYRNSLLCFFYSGSEFISDSFNPSSYRCRMYVSDIVKTEDFEIYIDEIKQRAAAVETVLNDKGFDLIDREDLGRKIIAVEVNQLTKDILDKINIEKLNTEFLDVITSNKLKVNEYIPYWMAKIEYADGKRKTIDIFKEE